MKDKNPSQIRTEAQPIRKKLLEEKGACENCGREENLVLHHITHPKDGGTNDPENLVLLCRSCDHYFHAVGGIPPKGPFETVESTKFITKIRDDGRSMLIPKPNREEVELNGGELVRVNIEKIRQKESEG